jgi:hypothetical protein
MSNVGGRGILTAAGLCSRVASLVCFGMPNADGRQCDVRASAKGFRWYAAFPFPAAALISHFGPLLHFLKEVGLGLLPTAAAGSGSRN